MLHRKTKPSNIRYEYSLKTSNTSLRPHIERNHLELYMSLVKEKGWKITLPGLLSQARSRAATVAVSDDERPDRFTERAFQEHLVKFMIVDDQVCSQVLTLSPCLYLSFQVSESCGVP